MRVFLLSGLLTPGIGQSAGAAVTLWALSATLVSAVILLPVAASAQPAQVTLRAALDPGAEIRWESVSSQRTTLGGAPWSLTETRQVVGESVAVSEVGGPPHIRQEIESIRYLSWNQGEGERSYDSEVDDWPSDPLLQSFARLPGTVSEAATGLPPDPRTVRFGPRLPGLLPEGAVGVGSSWDDGGDGQPGALPARAETSYRLVAIEERDGRTVARIEGTMVLVAAGGNVRRTLPGSGDADENPWQIRALFDVERGIVLELVRTLEHSVTVEGEELLVTLEQIERVL